MILVLSIFLLTTTCTVGKLSPGADDYSVPCVPKYYGEHKMVCLCNATVCDTFRLPETLDPAQFLVYTSSKSGLRFGKTSVPASTDPLPLPPGFIDLTIDPDTGYQTVFGFGGAITDATAIGYNLLSPKVREFFLNSYYSQKEGLGYNIARVPIASSDFSTRVYSYNDVEGDFSMDHFRLAPEDTELKIPLLKSILAVTEAEPLLSAVMGGGTDRPIVHRSSSVLQIFASPWSAPGWLKSNRSMIGGMLVPDPKYYLAWANYFAAFVRAYVENGIPLWALSVQNEPEDGYNVRHKFQSMLYTADQVYDFATNYLCPVLRNLTAELNLNHNLTLMVLDDNRPFLRRWAETILPKLNGSTDCIQGLAVHWYLNFLTPVSVQTAVHEAFPAYYILPTEACTGALPWENNVLLGDWARGEDYAKDIMDNLEHWAVGWTDWNIGLDERGGPNWIKNYVDSPVIFNASADEFYKQPMFYAIGHFSKFLSRDSVRIGLSSATKSAAHPRAGLQAVAFQTPKTYVVILLNRSDQGAGYRLKAPGFGWMVGTVEEHGIATIVWARDKGIKGNSVLKMS